MWVRGVTALLGNDGKMTSNYKLVRCFFRSFWDLVSLCWIIVFLFTWLLRINSMFFECVRIWMCISNRCMKKFSSRNLLLKRHIFLIRYIWTVKIHNPIHRIHPNMLDRTFKSKFSKLMIITKTHCVTSMWCYRFIDKIVIFNFFKDQL